MRLRRDLAGRLPAGVAAARRDHLRSAQARDAARPESGLTGLSPFGGGTTAFVRFSSRPTGPRMIQPRTVPATGSQTWPEARRDAHGGREPDARGGRQAVDLDAVADLEDGAGAEKPDAGDDALDDAADVGRARRPTRPRRGRRTPSRAHTSMWVRRPAVLWTRSRWKPISPPKTAARPRRPHRERPGRGRPASGGSGLRRVRPSSVVRSDHLLGPDVAVELLGRQVAERERGLLERRAVLVRLLGDLAPPCRSRCAARAP